MPVSYLFLVSKLERLKRVSISVTQDQERAGRANLGHPKEEHAISFPCQVDKGGIAIHRRKNRKKWALLVRWLVRFAIGLIRTWYLTIIPGTYLGAAGYGVPGTTVVMQIV